ncbi:MAG: NAD(P)/FAD-dependent oxidoreductase [Bifidobacteriaceae bacterium]|jgi:phytoene dehydrogenase-like protein|nr:NAD(P)/FAD-dependent oxidoreductase [Bifidobacteriaceae bacterium]
MIEHDFLVLGGGTNGLVSAGYLSKGGVDVGVIEGRSFFGGGAQTRELSVPGFFHETDSVAHHMIQTNPLIINDELELKSKYGLDYIQPEITTAFLFPDETYWCIYPSLDKTCESIAAISPKDAEAYRKFIDWAGQLTPMFTSSMWSQSPGFGQLAAMLDSDPGGQELLRALLGSAALVVNEFFTNEYIKVGLLKLSTEIMMSPWQDGTGSNLFLLIPSNHHFPMCTPRGGGIELPRSLVRCIEDHGGKIYLNSDINKILVEGGRAVGVQCANGETFRARKGILSTLHARQMFGGESPLIDPSLYPADMGYKVQRLSPSTASPLTCNYSLKEIPRYKAGGDVDRAFVVQLLPMMQEFRDHWDDCARGRLPKTPTPYVACHSIYDDSKAPAGMAAVQYYDPETYDLVPGGHDRWDQVREQQEDVKLAWWRKFAVNITDENILGRDMMSPNDLVRYDKNYMEGDNGGMGAQLYQFYGSRPIPALGRHRTPIDGLYLGGVTSHPGSGVSGGGRVPAQIVLEDMGIDFASVIG